MAEPVVDVWECLLPALHQRAARLWAAERPQAVALPVEQMALGQRSPWLTVEQWPQAARQSLV